MDYSRIYNILITCRRNTPLEKSKDLYTEEHHITPRCLGGDDSRENLVRLTAREHFLAHRLLNKLHPDNPSLKTALFLMCSRDKHGKRNVCSRVYETLKTAHSEEMSRRMSGREVSDETRHKLSKSHIGKVYSTESKQKMSDSAKRKPPMSNKTREKLSRLRKGKNNSQTHNKKISESHKGLTHSPESRMKMSESALRRFEDINERKKLSDARTKKYEFICPYSAQPFIRDVVLETFCRLNNIEYRIMLRSAKNGGRVCAPHHLHKGEISKNTVGWGCRLVIKD